MKVAFFGHADCLEEIIPVIKQTIIKLIEEENVDIFYVGNQGRFDMYTESILRECRKKYSYIKYYVVIPYLPMPTNAIIMPDPYETIFPEGIEKVPKRFAICKRNEWMIENSDIVVAYVTRSFGGAAKYRELAIKKARKSSI